MSQDERLEKFKKIAEADEAKEKAELIEALSAKDRLLRRLRFQTVQVPFTDDLGEFTIEARLLSPSESRRVSDLRMKLYKLSNQLRSGKSEKELNKLKKESEDVVSELYEIVGAVCIDPDLDAEYWKTGSGFNLDVPLRILDAVSGVSPAEAEATKKFREE